MLTSRQMMSCRRCGGRLYLEQDVFGSFLACIQCGAVHADTAGDKIKRAGGKLPAKTVCGVLPVVIGR